jgi:predicted DsbA family dithiol-disulfide isomerase
MMITLEIYSDPVCPWCFIGKVALERAMEARPDHPFVVSWHPFQLNPDMPADGMDRQEYLDLKFGADLVSAYRPIVERAEALGLNLDLPAITRQPNTLAAHALIRWAGLEGKQNAAVSALFRAYFQQGRDIGARDVLLDVAMQIGMNAELTARLLDAGADRDAIATEDREARARGIRGVPFFIVAGQHAVPGAQGTDLWVQVIDELAGQS